MRPSIKVMEIESWAKFEWDYRDEDDPDSCELGKGRYTEIPPRFNRDGLYLDRRTNVCWMEYKGHAWKGDLSMFKYQLKIEDWEIITEREEKALTEICKITRDTVLKKTLQKRLHQHREHRYLNDLGRGVERRKGKVVATYSPKLRLKKWKEDHAESDTAEGSEII